VPRVEEHDRPHYEEILLQLAQVDGWLARIDPDADHPRPAGGSPLFADDERTHPYQTSHAAWHALSHAVDALHCLRSVLRDAHTIHMYASYALIRAALENASAAVWMLHPGRRTERISRRLRFCALDVRSGEKALPCGRSAIPHYARSRSGWTNCATSPAEWAHTRRRQCVASAMGDRRGGRHGVGLGLAGHSVRVEAV
jgi:hypothetical protein